MKLKNHILALVSVVILVTISCKKDSGTPNPSNNPTTAKTIKYEVTWSSSVANFPESTIGYTNATGNTETDKNISGNKWSKTLTIDNESDMILGLGTVNLYLKDKDDTCKVRIFVNGVVKSESKGTFTLKYDDSAYAYGVQAIYTLKK